MHLFLRRSHSPLKDSIFAVFNRSCRILIIFLISLLSAETAVTQPAYDNIYRPSLPSWHQLSTPHFRIIYPEGEESAAIKSARILEDQYPVVQTLVGGSLSNMPVVLNAANDRSNGFVTTLNFRIEVEIPRILGKSMNPRDGNWLHTVMPHELVHALHLNVIPPFGVSAIIHPFSPDVARTMHMSAPLGMIEGIAVFHDTHLHYGVSGRGNHSYFTRQYKSVFQSSDRWTPSQNLREPIYSFPFDRQYIGGFTFINWLHYEYGMDTTSKTIRFVSRWPFLGYATALWYHTGERPSILFNEFEKAQTEIFRNGENDHSEAYSSPLADDIKRVRRPFWISGETVLFHATSYHKRPGIYSFDTQSNDLQQLFETHSTQDYLFTLHPDELRFLYARYHRHTYKHNYSRMRVHEVVLSEGHTYSPDKFDLSQMHPKSHQIGSADRIHAPVYGPDNDIWALRTHHENNMIVRLMDQITDTLLIPDNGHFAELTFHPIYSDSLVLLANRDGLQGLWFLHKNELNKYNTSSPDIAFDQASVYDPDWHPDGDRLLFTSDLNGTMNLYEYHLTEHQLLQLSDHKWGLMEGRYSPDGRRIAAVQLRDNRFELVILNVDDLPNIVHNEVYTIPVINWNAYSYSGPSEPFAATDETVDTLPDTWSSEKYRTGMRWVRPRALFPFWKNESNLIGNRYGLLLSSGDVLRRNSYNVEVSTSNNRIWYDMSYRFTGFYPGFRIIGYHRPAETTTGFWQRQGGGLEIPVPLLFDRNTRTSSLTIIPGIDFLQQRQISTGGNTIGNWVSRTTTSFSVTYRHRLQQNIRDVQPNTGWLLFSETEMDIASDFARGKLMAWRGGIVRFLSPNLRSNQSLRIGAEFVSQNLPLYDITGFYSRGFDNYILSGVNNAARLNTRYTIPLLHIDRGSLLNPFFFDRLYMVLFSDTVVPLIYSNTSVLYNRSRTLFGGGIRMRMRFFNIPFEIGVAFAYEPTRNKHTFYSGSF